MNNGTHEHDDDEIKAMSELAQAQFEGVTAEDAHQAFGENHLLVEGFCRVLDNAIPSMPSHLVTRMVLAIYKAGRMAGAGAEAEDLPSPAAKRLNDLLSGIRGL